MKNPAALSATCAPMRQPMIRKGVASLPGEERPLCWASTFPKTPFPAPCLTLPRATRYGTGKSQTPALAGSSCCAPHPPLCPGFWNPLADIARMWPAPHERRAVMCVWPRPKKRSCSSRACRAAPKPTHSMLLGWRSTPWPVLCRLTRSRTPCKRNSINCCWRARA